MLGKVFWRDLDSYKGKHCSVWFSREAENRGRGRGNTAVAGRDERQALGSKTEAISKLMLMDAEINPSHCFDCCMHCTEHNTEFRWSYVGNGNKRKTSFHATRTRKSSLSFGLVPIRFTFSSEPWERASTINPKPAWIMKTLPQHVMILSRA